VLDFSTSTDELILAGSRELSAKRSGSFAEDAIVLAFDASTAVETHA